MRICLLQGHPDAGGGHLCHALAEAYARGAEAGGQSLARLDVAVIAPEPLASAVEFASPAEGAIAEAQATLLAAEHLVVVFPLWLGGMPARLKAFFEQIARAQFALGEAGGGFPEPKLKGRSAHVIVTMGMPAIAYRVWFLNSGVAVLTRGILGMAGISPLRQTTIGGVDDLGEAGVARWLERMEAFGRAAR